MNSTASRPFRLHQLLLHRSSYWNYFGGLTFFLLALTVGTGLLLSIYYVPSASPALKPRWPNKAAC